MAYRLLTTAEFEKQFQRLDHSVQIVVKKWIRTHLLNTEDPRLFGKALIGEFKGYWRYRIGSYRLLAEIRDEECVLIAVDIGHRSVVYR